jgi:outer membrane immunogenic protein
VSRDWGDRMKIQVLVGITSTALLAAPAVAADMALLKPAAAPAPFNWTGGYVGFTAGGAWGSSDTSTSTSFAPVGGYLPNATTVATVNAAGPLIIKPTGFATGIEAGYNWQSGALVFGVEADLQAVHLSAAAAARSATLRAFTTSSSSAPIPTRRGSSPPARASGSWRAIRCSMSPAASP